MVKIGAKLRGVSRREVEKQEKEQQRRAAQIAQSAEVSDGNGPAANPAATPVLPANDPSQAGDAHAKRARRRKKPEEHIFEEAKRRREKTIKRRQARKLAKEAERELARRHAEESQGRVEDTLEYLIAEIDRCYNDSGQHEEQQQQQQRLASQGTPTTRSEPHAEVDYTTDGDYSMIATDSDGDMDAEGDSSMLPSFTGDDSVQLEPEPVREVIDLTGASPPPSTTTESDNMPPPLVSSSDWSLTTIYTPEDPFETIALPPVGVVQAASVPVQDPEPMLVDSEPRRPSVSIALSPPADVAGVFGATTSQPQPNTPASVPCVRLPKSLPMLQTPASGSSALMPETPTPMYSRDTKALEASSLRPSLPSANPSTKLVISSAGPLSYTNFSSSNPAGPSSSNTSANSPAVPLVSVPGPMTISSIPAPIRCPGANPPAPVPSSALAASILTSGSPGSSLARVSHLDQGSTASTVSSGTSLSVAPTVSPLSGPSTARAGPVASLEMMRAPGAREGPREPAASACLSQVVVTASTNVAPVSHQVVMEGTDTVTSSRSTPLQHPNPASPRLDTHSNTSLTPPIGASQRREDALLLPERVALATALLVASRAGTQSSTARPAALEQLWVRSLFQLQPPALRPATQAPAPATPQTEPLALLAASPTPSAGSTPGLMPSTGDASRPETPMPATPPAVDSPTTVSTPMLPRRAAPLPAPPAPPPDINVTPTAETGTRNGTAAATRTGTPLSAVTGAMITARPAEPWVPLWTYFGRPANATPPTLRSRPLSSEAHAIPSAFTRSAVDERQSQSQSRDVVQGAVDTQEAGAAERVMNTGLGMANANAGASSAGTSVVPTAASLTPPGASVVSADTSPGTGKSTFTVSRPANATPPTLRSRPLSSEAHAIPNIFVRAREARPAETRIETKEAASSVLVKVHTELVVVDGSTGSTANSPAPSPGSRGVLTTNASVLNVQRAAVTRDVVSPTGRRPGFSTPGQVDENLSPIVLNVGEPSSGIPDLKLPESASSPSIPDLKLPESGTLTLTVGEQKLTRQRSESLSSNRSDSVRAETTMLDGSVASPASDRGTGATDLIPETREPEQLSPATTKAAMAPIGEDVDGLPVLIALSAARDAANEADFDEARDSDGVEQTLGGDMIEDGTISSATSVEDFIESTVPDSPQLRSGFVAPNNTPVSRASHIFTLELPSSPKSTGSKSAPVPAVHASDVRQFGEENGGGGVVYAVKWVLKKAIGYILEGQG